MEKAQKEGQKNKKRNAHHGHEKPKYKKVNFFY